MGERAVFQRDGIRSTQKGNTYVGRRQRIPERAEKQLSFRVVGGKATQDGRPHESVWLERLVCGLYDLERALDRAVHGQNFEDEHEGIHVVLFSRADIDLIVEIQ